MLTRKQKELLLLIRDRLAGEGVPPSFDEMKLALGLKSKSGIHRLITGLEERGFIKRMPHRARALEILKLPEGIEKAAKTIKRETTRMVDNIAETLAESINLPLYGKIAAGTPIEALSDTSAQMAVPAGLLASSKGGFNANQHYVLEIAGDSMIEAGIMDSDHVIIRQCDHADNGSIVVALIDDHEATLKYLEKRNQQIALIPANQRYETKVFDPARVKIQGQLVGLIRRY